MDQLIDLTQEFDSAEWRPAPFGEIILPGEEESQLVAMRERVQQLWLSASTIVVIGYSFGLDSNYDSIWRQSFLEVPRILGVLLLVAGCAYVVSTLTFFLLPDCFRVVSLLMMVAAGAGEVSIVAWLLIKGARTEPVEDKAPTPGDDEVLIRIRAAAANPMDYHLMRGAYIIRPMTGLRKPKPTCPGADLAGEVEAVGRNVTRFGESSVASLSARHDPQGDLRRGRSETWRSLDWAAASFAQGARVVLVREPERGLLRSVNQDGRPDRSEGADRGQQGDTSHRPALHAERGP